MMADIAMVFHWSPTQMQGMDLEEFSEWHTLAVERAKLLFMQRR